MADTLKVRASYQMIDVTFTSSEIVVHTDNVVSFIKEAFTEVRAEGIRHRR